MYPKSHLSGDNLDKRDKLENARKTYSISTAIYQKTFNDSDSKITLSWQNGEKLVTLRPRKVLLERRISNLKQSAGKDEHFDKKKNYSFSSSNFSMNS